MRKTLVIVLAMLVALSLAACGNTSTSAPSSPEAPEVASTDNAGLSSQAPVSADAAEPSPVPSKDSTKLQLTEEGGFLVCLDLTNSPFKESGVKTIVDTSGHTVKFVKTGLDGKETVEYWTFNSGDNTVEKYYYVSMMGTGFYYYYDLTLGELVRIEGDEHEDKTQSTKDSGRYENANATTKDEVSKLSEYFEKQFGMTIFEAAAG